jgi:hypothetical protein
VISEPLPGTAQAATPPPDAPEPWRGEERLVREAILLVAANGAPRVLVAGIAQGEVVLDHLRRPALEAGVRLLARATADGDRVDVVVEAIR